MKKLFFILTIFITAVFGRDNPFEPVFKKELASSSVKETKKEYSPFSSVLVSFPSKARILKEICVKYQNVDGSIEKRTVNIDKEIDWHDPLILIKKSLLKSFQENMQKRKKSAKDDKKKKKERKRVKKEVKLNRFCTLFIEGKRVKINTLDKKIRSFMLVNPYKIVLDFKNPNDIESKTFYLNLPYIKRVVVGNHKNYYRVVFELDGHYGFDIKKSSNGYILSLK